MTCEKNIYEESALGLGENQIIRPGGLNLTRELIEGLELNSTSKILDIGCGTGVTVNLLRQEFGLEAYGLDCSEVLIEKGKATRAELPIQVGRGEALPYPSESFDAVIMECSFSTMKDKTKTLKELSRVLISGGKLGITDVYLRKDAGDLWQKIGLTTGCLVSAGTQSQIREVLWSYGFEIKTWQDKSQLWRSYIGEMLMGNCSLDLLLGAGVDRCQEKGSILEVIGKTRPGYFLMVAEKNGL